MGFFDIFRGNSLAKHAKRASSKTTHEADRWASIQALAAMESEEAADAILARFDLKVTPSITDHGEKELAVRSLISMGDIAVGPTKRYLGQTERISWPLGALQELVSSDEVVETLLEILGNMTTDYERDPQRKVDVLSQLETHEDDRIAAVVLPFLEDASEEARFHAVATVGAQTNLDETDAKQALLDCYRNEEGVRVRVQVLDVFAEQAWPLGDAEAEVAAKIPPGFSISDGKVLKG